MSVKTADAIVIGGGLQGCSAALNLARRGLSVIVVEKDYVGRHASGVNAGGVRRLGRNPAEIPLADAAIRLWHDIEGLVNDDCGFRRSLQVKVAESEGDMRKLEARAALVRELGFDHEVTVGHNDLRTILPAVSHHCVGALVVHGDGSANPYRTTMAFKRAAVENGAHVIEGVRVAGVERRDGSWRVTTSDGAIDAATLVNCAGAWGDVIASALDELVPLIAGAPMLMISARMPHFTDAVVGMASRKLSFKQFDNGTVMMGGGYRGVAQRDSNTTVLDMTGLAQNARAAWDLFPVMRGARIVRAWAGIEGFLPDELPVIGRGRQSGTFHAFGFSAHGFQLGPIVGEIIADLVTEGRTSLPIEPFRIDRFN